MTPLMQWVNERAWRDESGCLIWKFACAHGKEPQGRYMGEIIRVRRVVYEKDKGRELTTNTTVLCTCGTAKCVEPSHLIAKRRLGRKGQKWTIADRAKISAGIRAKWARLTPEAVADIRSGEEHRTVYAQRYGIAKEYVTDIQGFRAWKDYSNPFIQLAQWRPT